MIRSRRISFCLCVLAAVGLAGGCDVIFNLFPGSSTETGKSQLLPFGSEKELADYMRDQIAQRNTDLGTFDREFEDATATDSGGGNGAAGGVGNDNAAPSLPGTGDGALVSEDADSSSDFSGTTTQETGVDEADVVKTDGNYLYVLTTEWPNSVLRIVDISDPTTMTEVGSVALEGYGQDFYLIDDQVIALTSNGGGFYYFGGIEVFDVADGDAGSSDPATAQNSDVKNESVSDDATTVDVDREPASDQAIDILAPDYVYDRPFIAVTVIDVTDRSTPAIQSTTRLDGSIASSRMIDGILHLVAANFQNYYYDALPLLGTSALEVDTVDTVTLLPSYSRTNADGTESSGDVLTWEQLYRPVDPDGFGIVYVASVDIANDAAFSAVGVVAEPGLIYSSLEALYLTDTQYDFRGGARTTTDVYKFAYNDRGVTPVAAGTVQGRILNQYSMGEHNGYLRVATTVDATFGPFGQLTPASNHIYVLEESGDGLDVVGSVEGIAPRETIQAARFIGDRGFVVTFEQIDPLFTIDLSDPANPRVVGELKVPGFSTFLVPIDQDHLLAVGQHVPPPGEFGAWGVQLSIFDVTDFAQPTLMDSVTIGDDTGAYSEALYNPKAFTYFAERGTVALPVSVYERYFGGIDDVVIDDDGGTSSGSSGSSGSVDAATPPSLIDSDVAVDDDPASEGLTTIEPYVPGGFDGLIVYSVSLESGLTEIGRISTRFPEAGVYWSSFTRGVFVGNDVLAVTDYGVHGAAVDQFESDQFELLFDRTDASGSVEIAVPDAEVDSVGSPATEPRVAP